MVRRDSRFGSKLKWNRSIHQNVVTRRGLGDFGVEKGPERIGLKG
jgi:hypothetical protein